MTYKTHDALLRLACNPEGNDAMLAVYVENRDAIRAAFRRWVGGRKNRNFVELGVMVHVARLAHLYDPKKQRAEDWVAQRADMYCWQFRVNLENRSAWKN